MRSLFLRIFLSLSIALVLISLAVIIAAVGTGGLRLAIPLFARSFLGDEIAASADSALALYRSSGTNALGGYFDQLREANGTEGWLIRADGRDVLGHPIPDSVLRVAGQLVQERLPVVELRGFRMTAATRLQMGNEDVVVAFLRRLNRQPRARVVIPAMGMRYLAGLLAAIVFSYLLSRLIAQPVEQLRLVMRRYSGGGTALVLPPKLVARRDELGDLAREFDQMRHRIEGLLARQQQLIADISHELRSPLTRLAVAVEIALDSAEREPELLDRIKSEISVLEGLIQQLLRLAALENQGAEKSMHAVALHGLLAGIVENAEFEAVAAGKHVVYASAEGSVTVAGDEFLLASALENILRNAIRYTAPQTSVRVVVRRVGSGNAVIEVLDEGPGVPEHLLTDMFRPFFRVETARDRDAGGAGLGLSIAQRSIAVCGGSVSAKNYEKGLLVEVRLRIWS